MRKFQTMYTPAKVTDEVNNLPSETIPDQSMSIQEIVRRFTSGLPISGQRVPYYESEDETGLPDMSRMNKLDRIDLARQIGADYKELKEKHDKAAKEALQREEKRKLLEQLKTELAEGEKSQTTES